MNSRWRRIGMLCAGSASIVGIWVHGPVKCLGATERFVPGELIVSFVDRGEPVMAPIGETFTSVYPALNSVLGEFRLSGLRPLFCPDSPLKNVFVFEFPANTDLDAVTSRLVAMPFIKHTEKNLLLDVDLDMIPSNYACRHDWWCNGAHGRTDTWALWSMQLDRAWDITRGDSSVVVAIMDDGLDYCHPFLGRNVWQNLGEDSDHDGRTLVKSGVTWVLDEGDINGNDDDGNGKADDLIGWDFRDNDGDPISDIETDITHGTNMGSLVSCTTNTSPFGTAGITWFTKLMPLRSVRSSQDDYVESAWVIGATNYAAAKGADIVNMSFSTDTCTAAWHDAIVAASNAGVIFVSSAGVRNVSGRDLSEITKRYPQWWEEVICVAAVDTFGYKTDVPSNWGSTVDICGYSTAPLREDENTNHRGSWHVVCWYTNNVGKNCAQVDPDEPYPGTQGVHTFWYSSLVTSGACAEVSGVLALLKAMYPNSSSDFLKQELYRGATPLPDPRYAQGMLGHGAINAYRSLTQWGTISQNTTWSNTVYVSGDLTVETGKTLTIAPGTIVNFAFDDNESMGSDTTRIEFLVNGYLDARGTAANPVVFQGWNTNGRADWVGISVSSQSTGAYFDYVVVKNAERGILHSVPVTIRNSTISDCDIGIDSYAGLTLRGSRVTHCTDFCVRVGQGTVSLDVDTLAYGDQHGIDLHVFYPGATVSATIDSCWIHGNGVGGVVASGEDVSLLIDYSTIEDNYNGIVVGFMGPDWRVLRSSVTGNNSGVVLGDLLPEEPVSASISECVVDGNTTNGVWVSTGVCFIGFSSMSSNTFGMNLAGSQTVGAPYACEFVGNLAGVRIDTGARCYAAYDLFKQNINGITTNNDGLISIANQHNSFIRNAPYHIVNFNESTIDAVYNWWGKSTGPDPTKFYGSVIYEPWDQTVPPLPSAPGGPPSGHEPEKALPASYALGLGHPNPFNPTTTIQYDVPEPGGAIHINIYDVTGGLVRTLVNESKPAGFHTVMWDAMDSGDRKVGSGVYFVRMEAGGFFETRKLVVLK